jgi:hypothetical protein
MNHKTVDPNNLPKLHEIREITDQAWEVLNTKIIASQWFYRDFWTNSTPSPNVRELRIRVKIWVYLEPETQRIRDRFESHMQELAPEVRKVLSQLPEHCWKQYRYGQAISWKIYYRSWEPGDPKELLRYGRHPDAKKYPADLPLGTEVKLLSPFDSWNEDGPWKVVRRYNKNIYFPRYDIKNPKGVKHDFSTKYVIPA